MTPHFQDPILRNLLLIVKVNLILFHVTLHGEDPQEPRKVIIKITKHLQSDSRPVELSPWGVDLSVTHRGSSAISGVRSESTKSQQVLLLENGAEDIGKITLTKSGPETYELLIDADIEIFVSLGEEIVFVPENSAESRKVSKPTKFQLRCR